MKRFSVALTVVALACYSFAHTWKHPDHAAIGDRLVAAETDRGVPQPPAAVGHPAFMSPHASPIAVSGGMVFVANTPAVHSPLIGSTSPYISWARMALGLSRDIL